VCVYQSNKKSDEFIVIVIGHEKGENLLENDSKNQWAKFFIAGADGYKGTFEARYEKWIMLSDMEEGVSYFSGNGKRRAAALWILIME
jgi:hypothetical protein